MTLPLKLQTLPPFDVKGIYTVGGQKGQMPARTRFLYPQAADCYHNDLTMVTVSDMLRSAESSLEAVQSNRGALPPAYSGHNYGFSIDLDIAATMKTLGLKTKAQLDAWMEERGWYCHRRDHKMESEAWHFNYLRLFEELKIVNKPLVIDPKVNSTAGYLEKLIVDVYGTFLRPSDTECQAMLLSLKMYSGKVDGIMGPLSQEAVKVFQRAWVLKVTGTLDDRTRRTLAFVCATKVIT